MHTHQRVSFAARGQAGVELPVAGIADGVYNMTAALGPPYSAGAWVAFAKRSPARRPALEVRHGRGCRDRHNIRQGRHTNGQHGALCRPVPTEATVASVQSRQERKETGAGRQGQAEVPGTVPPLPT